MGHAPFSLIPFSLSSLIYRHRVYLVLTHSLHIRSSSLYFIIACTDVIRKVCSCVHTYVKATYDVHAVFSVHVCHSLIHCIICSLLYDCLFPPFIFKFFFWYIQTVYTAYEHCNSLEFHWNMTFWHMLPGHFNKYTSGIYCILREFQRITGLISCGWYSEVYSSHCISLLYDCTWCLPLVTAFILYTPCTHCVDIVTWVLRIRNLYIWYTYSTHLSTKKYIVYTTCIHPVSFSGLSVRPPYIYVSQTYHLPIVPVACGCLLGVARLRGGLVHKRLVVYTIKTAT